MGSELLESIRESLGRPQLYLKLAFVLVTIPIWGPILKSMWRELSVVLDAEGGLFGNNAPRPIGERPPGLDPFVNVPRTRGGLLRPHRGTNRPEPPRRATRAASGARRPVVPTPARPGFRRRGS